MSKKKFKTGTVNLPMDVSPKNTKVRISIYVDGDVLQAFKEKARKTASGEYQVLMRDVLREHIFGRRPIDKETADALQSMVAAEVSRQLRKRSA